MSLSVASRLCESSLQLLIRIRFPEACFDRHIRMTVIHIAIFVVRRHCVVELSVILAASLKTSAKI